MAFRQKKKRSKILEEYRNKAKAYTSCRKCRILVNMREINCQNLQQNKMEPYIKIQGEIYNICLVSQKQQEKIRWVILCQKCRTEIGKFQNQILMVNKQQVLYKVIKYCHQPPPRQLSKCQTANAQNKVKNMSQLHNRAKKYLSCSFNEIQSRFKSINTKKMEQISSQLHNFLVFYKKWINKSLNSNGVSLN